MTQVGITRPSGRYSLGGTNCDGFLERAIVLAHSLTKTRTQGHDHFVTPLLSELSSTSIIRIALGIGIGVVSIGVTDSVSPDRGTHYILKIRQGANDRRRGASSRSRTEREAKSKVRTKRLKIVSFLLAMLLRAAHSNTPATSRNRYKAHLESLCLVPPI